MSERSVVIFVSQRNSLRSILAQACLAHLGADRFLALSCGRPGMLADAMHPAAIGALNSASMPAPNHRPRDWNDLSRPSAPRAEFVITLDEASSSFQPRWPGQPDAALWVFPDVVAVGDPEKVAHLAIQTLYALRRRLELFVSLPLHGTDRAAIRSDLRDLAHMR
jgi:arsenate reductase (thioredoxin)